MPLTTYTYSVDMKTGLKTIQQAIDRLAVELQGNPKIEKDVTILVGRGVYPGFRIPKGMMIPFLSAGYQLIIKSRGSYFPVIDGRISPTGIYIGADVDSANPNVQIERLRLQNFSVGVRATLNSHNIVVRECITSDNTNVGVFIEQCDNTILSNNIIVNGDFGIVTRLCKNISLLHNTVLLNGTIGDGQGAIWAQLANDYGGGTTDTGELHMLGNVAWNMTEGATLILFQEDLEGRAVISNFNDWVRTGDHLIGLERKGHVPTTPRKRRKIFGLKEWRSLGFNNPDNSPLDSRSISQDPKFLQPIKGRKRTNGLYIDLTLLPISPVLGIVPSFYFDSSQAAIWLPSYIDATTLINKDILNNTRLTDGTAAGANDKRSNSGYFGQDVFISPRSLNPNKDCDVDPLKDLIYKKLDLWFPRLKVGFFNSHEREYYLYAKKHCRFLGECAVTEFRLPARVVTDRTIKVSVAGDNIRDPRYIDIRGDSVLLYHFDLNIQDGTEEFEIQCWIRRWDNQSYGFIYLPVHYRFKINEGRTRYLIPPDYNSSGPVIITDDVSSMTDREELSNREYRTIWDSNEQREEIKFANDSNMFLNAQFDRIAGDTAATPLNWVAANSIVESGSFTSPFLPVMGDHSCRISPSGYISQLVPMTSGNYTLSWHCLSTTTGGTTIVPDTGFYYKASFYDANFDSVGISYSGTFSTTGEWVRNYVTFGKQDPNIDTAPSVVYPLSEVANHEHIPDITAHADISLMNTTTGSDLWIDATQYEQSSKPTMYHRKVRLDELTVEYETSNNEEFIDTRQSMAPVRNMMSQGFLHIPEIPSAMYGGPRVESVTTLAEYRWPQGRMNILPWARLTGKDKLRHKHIFNTVPERPKQRIEPAHPSFYPFEVAVAPDELVARQNDKNGVGLEIHCINEFGNPFALGNFFARIKEPLGRFPGWLHKKHLGAKEQLGAEIVGLLDSSGSSQMLWIPPDGRSVVFVGSVPRRPSGASGDVLSSIEVNYRVNGDFHGNIIALDDEFNRLPLIADSTNKNIYKPSFSRNLSIIRVKYPPSPGSVKVSVNGSFFTETFVDSPDSDQFYVDYGSSQILLRGRVSEAVVEYLPFYAFVNSSSPYNILFFHDQVFGSYTGPLTVGYDALVDLEVSVGFPTTSNFVSTRIAIIAQNYMISENRHINPLAAEY